MFTRLSDYLHDVPTTSQDTVNVSKTSPTIAIGMQQLRVQMQNPPVGSAQPRANRARDKVTQRVASSWHTQGPIEGTHHPEASYLSLDREASFMPSVWVSIYLSGFS
jgi:hypothetical protein